MSIDRLFEPLRIKAFTVKNRLVFPPTASVTGTVTDRGLAWYDHIARGGVGTVIVEGTKLGLFRDPAFAAGLPALAATIKGRGALAVIQLFQPPALADGTLVSVSGAKCARALTAEELRGVVRDFGHATEVAVAAGFDGVEPHGAHGFLLNQFFAPLTNWRTDAYGGTPEGRMRLGLEITRAVRAAAGPDRLVFYRHTPEQNEPGGYTLGESLRFAGELATAGLDVLDISPSTRNGGPLADGRELGPHAGLAEAFRDVVETPIMAVGGMDDPAAAAAVLAAGKVDLLGICRGLIADAEWPNKVAAGQFGSIVRCTKCNEKCFGNLRCGVPIACAQWPDAG